MPQQEKAQKVAELKERITGSSAIFLADFRGMSVGDVGELRRTLTPSGARFTVVKNTLMKRAAGEAGVEDLDPLLEGPTAVAFVDGDAVTAAKTLVDSLRRFRTMSLKGGYMEGRVLTPEQAQSIATIEPREVLLAKIAGGAKVQMSRAAYMFQALQSRFVALLEAFREKVPSGEPAAETPTAETAETPGPDTAETPGAGTPSAETPTAETAVESPAAEEAPGAGPEQVVAPREGGTGTEIEEPAPDAGMDQEATEEEVPVGDEGDDQSVTEAQTSVGEGDDGKEGKE